MTKKHLAIYGDIKMIRVYCSKCKSMTLVVDDKKLCCDENFEDYNIKNKKNMCISNITRKRPSFTVQKEILEKQNNKCLYCDKPFGTMYYRDGKVLFTKLHFDHLVPFSYSKENKYNFVAACNICNGIKSSKIFKTIKEVFYYVEYQRRKRNITYYEDLPSMSEEINTSEEGQDILF